MRIIKVFTAVWLLILGIIGCQREEEYPQAPILISPEDGEVFTDQAPVFVWQSVDDATEYTIRISKDSFAEGAALVEDTLEDTTYTMTDNIFQQLSTGAFEWAVAPLPAEDELLWSEIWSFNVDKSSPPPPPILIAPEDGAVFDLKPPDFIWHKDSEATNYVIRIVKDAFFTGDIIVEDTLGDTTYTMSQEDFEFALNGDYVWSVAPVIQGGITWREFRTIILDKPLPAPPQLVSPKEGAEFSTDPPTFIWRSVSLAKAYIILLHGENLPYGDTIAVDTLEDTTYALPREVFEGCYNGTYKWCVASLATTNQAFWSNERSLSFNQPAPQLDLDTTYFPFGLEYTWIYEEYEYCNDGEWYDTITIRVVDSTFVSNGWNFDLEGTFLDVDDPARIIGNQILIFGSRKISLTPEPIKEVKSEGGKTFTFEISYKADTLHLLDKMEEFWDPIGGHDIVTSVSRVKDIGVISQSHSDWEGGNEWYGSTCWHTLLYFVVDQDTVWRREEL